MDRNCLIGFITLSIVIVIIVLSFLDYKGKMTKKSITLEKNDKQHEHKHLVNKNRIEELEKKNGAEQRQIDQLKQQIKELEKKLNHEKQPN